jgi:thymidine kinase
VRRRRAPRAAISSRTLDGRLATAREARGRQQILVQSRERVLVGAQNAYEARCRACFDPTLAG